MNIDRERLFGTDLRIAEQASGLDLLRDSNGDLDLAYGNDNIIQALILRLKVMNGELAPLGWPDFGSRLHELIGEPNNARTHVILMSHARNAIEKDPRVKKVINVETMIVPGERTTVRIIMDIQLINEQNPLNLIYDFNLEGK